MHQAETQSALILGLVTCPPVDVCGELAMKCDELKLEFSLNQATWLKIIFNFFVWFNYTTVSYQKRSWAKITHKQIH